MEVHATWVDARDNCLALGADLASVTSQDEQDFIHNLELAEDVWIGANDRDEDKTFEWSNGDFWGKGSFKFWQNGQPDHKKDQDCVKMRFQNGRWTDLTCDKAMKYVCQKVDV